MKNSLFLGSAVAVVVLFTASFASAAVMNGLTSDAELRRTGSGDGGGSVHDTSAGSLNIGRNNGSSTANHPIFVFQLPDFGAVVDPFTEATLSVSLVTSNSNWGGFNTDIWGLGARNNPTPLGSDAYVGTNDTTDATKIRDDFKNFNTSSPSTGTFDTSNSALLNYLNDQYADGANAGNYIFIRISPTGVGNSWKDFRWASAENGTAANRPVITYEAIPEPASLMLVASGGCLMLLRRRAKSTV